jgi:Carbohydrate family 9 binding domain-like
MITIALSLALSGINAGGQSDTLRAPQGDARAVQASRVGSNSIVLDGVLTEAGWSGASPVSDFTQREPDEGAAATERTEVRVLYDDDALYVGARMYDRSPDSVMAQLARRDRIVSADRFIVFLDSYHDRRTGFFFGINAAGTLYDGTLYNDDWDSDTWDGVWQGSVARDSLGWSAELRIPYSQLRFQRQKANRWGINFKREIARRNERSYLVCTPSNGSGFVSRFVDLVGLEEFPTRPSGGSTLRHHAGRVPESRGHGPIQRWVPV